MITFSCSECGEKMEAPESLTGEMLQCPACRFPQKVPDIKQGLESIKLEEPEDENQIPGTEQIRTFESDSQLDQTKEFKRALIKTGNGATRVRTFHSKLSDKAMHYLDEQINEWLDNNTDIEVKFSNTTVGVVEGKKTEPHVIVTVWY